MENLSQYNVTSLNNSAMKEIQGGAVWLWPVVKGVAKVGGAILAVAATYDGAQDFAEGYAECREE